MIWSDVREIVTQVDADNRTTGIIVKMTMQPQGLLIDCDQRDGFFAYRASRIIAYSELEHAVSPRGLVMSYVNDVRAVIKRHHGGNSPLKREA